jgi:hypothetical protein
MLESLEADMGLTRSAIIEVSVREFFRKQFRGRKPPESRDSPEENA